MNNAKEMKPVHRTVKEVVNDIEVLTQEKNEYALSLKALRSKDNWEPYIESDGRASVRNLYKMYNETKAKIMKLLECQVIE